MKLTTDQQNELLQTLKRRFDKNMHRHPSVQWADVEARLLATPDKLWSLYQMEETGGEPDVLAIAMKPKEINSGDPDVLYYAREPKVAGSAEPPTDSLLFVDFAPETPKGRRSICYDQAALEARKEYKPRHSAIGMAQEMGIELLTEALYFQLQAVENVDKKTSSWLKTEEALREKGGAIFGDWRYGRVFIYHNGADSYYSVRGFRGMIRV
ncbi:MAG: DUF4256 domain-containing protein [Paludibacter sp.]|jgi:hypothetical protein|nr:DUF4256 domain-containing protein [Paludibacter sp.]